MKYSKLFKNEETDSLTFKNKVILSLGQSNILEMVFYKKSIGSNELAFFKEVSKIFCEENSISEDDLPQVVEKIKTYKSATKIKNIFKKACENAPVKNNYSDLNTTALCMLHRSLISSSLNKKKISI